MGTIEKRGKNSWRIREWVYLGSKRYPVDVPLRFPASMSEEEQISGSDKSSTVTDSVLEYRSRAAMNRA